MRKITSQFAHKRIVIPIILSVLLCCLIGGTIFAAQSTSMEQAQTAEQALQQYISNFNTTSKASLTDSQATQKAVVEEAFGIGAWDQVEYKSISGVAPIVREVYRKADTGTEISINEYQALVQANVDQICKKYNFDPSYLSLQGKELMTKLTSEEVVNRNLILQEINQNSPVQVGTEAAVPYQYFSLTFKGQDKSIDGQKGNFRILMVQQDGKWCCYDLYADDIGSPENDY